MNNKINMNTTIYCGVEGSVCNKNYRFHGHSVCCMECKEGCSNCIISTNKCIYKKTKQELKEMILIQYNQEKDQLESELRDIKQKIVNLNNE